jgi:hypothetical protein
MALPGMRFAGRNITQFKATVIPELPTSGELVNERHYTITELAEKCNFSYEFVRRLFMD